MAVTRIKNNQVTDASGANTQLGINANTKLQNYSVTSGKLANNLVYGSDFTVTGNLTVQGNTTTIDTTITTIEDPVIVLASTQTSGAPTVDIGFLGYRGNQSNIAFVWDESGSEFVTAFTSTGETNTTITITSYADFHTNNANIGGNIVINGTTSLVGNIIGAVSFTGNITAGNLLTPGLVSATGNVRGGNVNTAGAVSATGNVTGGNVNTAGAVSATGAITSAANITGGNILTSGQVSATGNGTFGNISTAGTFGAASLSASGNVTGGNLVTAGLITATGNVTGGNLVTGGAITATGTITSATTITGGNLATGGTVSATGNVTGGNILFGSGIVTGTGNIYGGNIIATDAFFGNIDLTGDITVNSLTSNTYISAGGNVIGANISTAGLITATGTITGGNLATAGTVSATGNVTGGNILTGGLISATSTITSAANVIGGNITTAGVVTATGNVTGGNILTGGIVSATGNVIADNVVTDNVVSTAALTLTTGSNGNINIQPNGTGNIVLSNTYINSVRYPVQDQDAASKIYVDNLVSTAISYHEAVFAATTTTLASTTGGTITYNQPGGAGNGIGATLTTTGSFNLIDTANVQTANTRILVKDEANAAHNGVYVWSNATVITRSSDTNTYGAGNVDALGINDYFYTTNGNVNKGTAFIVDAPTGTITFGTSNIQFAIFSQSQVYSANTDAGLSLVGTQFNAKVDNNTTAFDIGGNIIVKAGANLTTPNIGAATGTSLSVTGNVTGGNVNTAGLITATGNVTGGNILTGGLISATSTITSAANVIGGNITTAGLITATGNVTAGNVNTAGAVSATGNLTGGNVNTAGTVSATGNIQGGNIQTAGLITATGAVTAGGFTTTGNVTGGNILFGSGIVSGTGNVYASNFIGNISGNIDAGGANTEIQFNDSDTLAGNPGFTFNKVGNVVTANGNITGANLFTGGSVSATANITGGNLLTAGLISATGSITSAANVTGGNITTSGVVTATGNVTGGNINTAGLITATGNVTGGNLLTAGLVSATGTLTGSNLILTSGTIDGPASGRITINGADADVDFAVDGDTLANIFYVDAGTSTASFGSSTQVTNAIVNFATTNSIKVPVGNTAQRPGTGVTGMIRFNTTNNNIEVYDNSQWTAVGVPVFTVIADEQFNGDGSTVVFTLTNGGQTTNSCIISINGVVQIPTLAYAVSGAGGNVLTFTEAPAAGDVIDVREVTTTTTVTSISNTSGNAVIAVTDAAAQVDITGNLIPSVANTYSLGNASYRWANLFVSGNTITLGNTVMKNTTGNTIGFFGPDGTTPATIDAASIDTTQIASGTSNVKVVSSGGNVTTGIGGTANVVVVATTGQFVTGVNSVSGNVTGGNLLTAGLISATGAITGAALTGTSLTVSTGNVSCGNIVNTNANGVGNIGSASTYFNTVFAKATSAQYADLAEKYTADADYEPGTVVMFDGEQEVTACNTDACPRVAGVISTNPSYIMNGTLESAHVATVALTGRVPTKVSGTVRKGDLMVSAGNGRARSEVDPRVGTVIGKALADSEGDTVIEIVVGRV